MWGRRETGSSVGLYLVSTPGILVRSVLRVCLVSCWVSRPVPLGRISPQPLHNVTPELSKPPRHSSDQKLPVAFSDPKELSTNVSPPCPVSSLPFLSYISFLTESGFTESHSLNTKLISRRASPFSSPWHKISALCHVPSQSRLQPSEFR